MKSQRLSDAIEGLRTFLEAIKDGELTNEEIADAIDDALDTGPLDTFDDRFILMAVDKLAGLLKRDPAKMRERADKIELAGNPARADRIRARADKVEAKQ